LKHEVKIGANKYGPGMFDHQIDICEMVTGLNVPVLNFFIPKQHVDAILHPCPYRKVSWLLHFLIISLSFCASLQNEPLVFKNFTFDLRNIPVIYQPGEYRLTLAVRKGKFSEVFAFKILGHRCVSNTV
jgi:hypothetical protein